MAGNNSKGVQKKVSKVGVKKASSSALKSGTAGPKALAKATQNDGPKPAPSKGASKARSGMPSKATTPVKTSVKKITKKAIAQTSKPKKVTAEALPKVSKAKPAKDEPKAKVARAKSTALNADQVTAKHSAPQVNAAVTTSGTSLNVGDVVPVFQALDQTGQTVSNREWGGSPYVLYFYPKDDTPGCTTEACGFRDELPSFGELGVKVVGCSPDSPNAHTRFATKYGLQFTLLADIEKELAQMFGVWKLKNNYGREYMGVERSTFLIDKSGKVARQWRGVRVAGHVSEVLSAVRDLP